MAALAVAAARDNTAAEGPFGAVTVEAMDDVEELDKTLFEFTPIPLPLITSCTETETEPEMEDMSSSCSSSAAP